LIIQASEEIPVLRLIVRFAQYALTTLSGFGFGVSLN